jgi:hypothetical protein
MARIGGLMLAGIILAVGTGSAIAHGSVATKPVLKLVQRAPLKIQGFHFKARERVRLTASTTGGHAAVTTRSARLGRVTALFSNFSPATCLRLVVTAVGARGDRATLVVNPPPPTPIPCPA